MGTLRVSVLCTVHTSIDVHVEDYTYYPLCSYPRVSSPHGLYSLPFPLPRIDEPTISDFSDTGLDFSGRRRGLGKEGDIEVRSHY